MSKFGELISTKVPVLLNFYTTWDEDCNNINDSLIKVSAALGHAAKVVKIDVEKNPELSDALRIKGLPTLIIYKDGEMKWRHSGVQNSSELISVLQKYTSEAS